MRGCLNLNAISPSVGFFKPLNRASRASVFALSKTFRPTIFPVSRSRAMLKFDMVPETASRRISYRLATSTLPPSMNDLKNWPIPTGACEQQSTKRSRSHAKPLRRKEIKKAERIHFAVLCVFAPLREVFDSLQYTNRPRSGLLAAIIDCPGDFALQVASADNSVDVAVLQQELAGLKALRQFHAERRFDCP